MGGSDVAELRAAFPVLARLAYLNAGTCGPVPAASAQAARAEIERELSDGRLHANSERRFELQDANRRAYAALLGCDAADVALTTSTTEGAGVAVRGLALEPGDEIVTSDEEHPGLLGPLQAARDLQGARVRVVPFAETANAVGPHTRLVATSHVSWVTGALAPEGLRDVDVPVLLDGAQGIGAVPADVSKLGCDLYAGSGQKWLCGPEGTGMLYVSPALRDRLAPTARGYTSYSDASAGLDATLRDDAARYDTPVLGTPALAAASAALQTLSAAGWDSVQARARALASWLAEALRERGREVAPRGETTLVAWRCADAEAERARLTAAGIAIRDLPGRDHLRASVGAWNDESDLERLLEALG